ncbi:hypothetical protein MKX03_000647, partial [Papaver bracteatum]
LIQQNYNYTEKIEDPHISLQNSKKVEKRCTAKVNTLFAACNRTDLKFIDKKSE